MSHTANLVDPARRRWVMTTSLVGGAGVVAASAPFVGSLAPSERARAFGAPVAIAIASIKPGELRTVEWRGKPVWVLRRTPQMIDALRKDDALLSDPRSARGEQQPDYVRNELRSLKPDLAVLVAVCTHLGCVPTFRPEPGAADIGASWPGGFYCQCHGSKFDLAGRVFQHVPAPSNLEVPPHRYASDTLLIIGADAKS